MRVVLRPFRVSDAAAIAESCRDPDIPRFTMMPEAMTEAHARQWVERGLERWSRGLARFAVTVPPSDECVGQMGMQFDFATRRAEAFYWLDRRVRGRGIAVEALNVGSDRGLMRPMLEALIKRYGRTPRRHLVDGGFNKKEDIEGATELGMATTPQRPGRPRQ